MTTTTGPRYPTLDIVRGVAVMGILAMNIQAFALPEAAYFMPVDPTSAGAANEASWGFDYVFFMSKMRSLFSILFGASCLLIIERAWASDHSAVKIHYSRMVWLFLFGFAHFIFIWWGDILSLYALSGMILYFARNLSVKALWIWAVVLLSIDTFLFVSQAVLGLMAWGGALPADVGAEVVAEMNNDFGYVASKFAEETALMAGSYGAIVTDRIEKLPDQLAFWIILQISTLGLMFLGMALYRNGFLTSQWEASRYRKWAIMCFALSLPPQIAFAIWAIMSDYAPMVGFAINLGFATPFTTVMAVGYAALIILWWKSRGHKTIAAQVLAKTRQMAFTNYLGTSIVMTTIFYGYGLGLFGQVERYALWGFVLCAWAAMMAGSWHWLARYRYGPLEWLWRSLARAKLQPMRRNQI